MHTFLALDMNTIPQATKDNVPTFWCGLFSNDKSRMLIDGYNEQRQLVHPQSTMSAWLKWSGNPLEIQEALLSEAQELTIGQLKLEQQDINSIWYVEPEEFI